MSGRASRLKGQRGERRVVNKIKHIFPNAKRNLNDFQGGEGRDLQNTGRLAIQVKHFKKHTSFSKIKEIICNKGEIPLLVSWPTDKGTGKPMIAMYLDDFLNIIDEKKVK